MSDAQLKLALLSGWKLAVNNAGVDLAGRKRRALLTYLIFEAGSFSHRDELALLLWPLVESRKAKASLRQALTDLRKLLGSDFVQSDGNFVSISNNLVSTDVSDLIAALQCDVPVSKEQALSLRGIGRLMRDFDGVTPQFDEWLQETRRLVLDRVFDAAMVHFQNKSGSPKIQLALARAALELDPLFEAAIRAQMQALADLNDNAAALRVYHGFYNLMEDELAVEPAIETQEIAIKIKLQTPFEDADLMSATPALGSARPLTLMAVLPFEKRGNLDIPDYVILGILDQITCKLATFRTPAVISSNSTRQFLGQPTNPMTIARQFDARYVVNGSISGTGSTLVLSVQLCDGINGHVCWAKNMELTIQEALNQSLTLAEEIARAIEPSFNQAELSRANMLPAHALEPHHLVLQAKDLMFRMSYDDFAAARGLLDQALVLDHSFSPAFSLSAEWFAINLWQGWSQHQEHERATLVEHARRAIQNSPGDGRSMAQWGHHKVALERDFNGALALMEEAQKLAPSDSEMLIWTVPTLAHSGQSQRAVQNGAEAARLSPFDPFKFRNEHFLSLAHYANGDFEAAVRLGLSCYAKAPNYGSNLRVTIASLQASDRTSEAAELAVQHAKAEPNYSLAKVRKKMGFQDKTSQDVYVSRLLSAGVSE